MIDSAAQAVSDATRRTLDEVDQLDGEVNAVIVLVEAKDQDGNTHIHWNYSPDISPAWILGILLTASQQLEG